MTQFPFINPGDPTPRRADTLNAQIEAAAAHLDKPQPKVPRTVVRHDPSVVMVRNGSGSDVERFGILGLGDARITQANNDNEFYRQVYFDSATPAIGTHDNHFAVALEPIKNGKVGKCAVHGVVQCQVTMNETWHEFADITNSDATKLASGHVGNARILWVAATSGDQWAYVHLYGGIKLHQPVPVVLAKTAGADGDSTSAASWTYRMEDLAGNTIDTGVDPTASPHNWHREYGLTTTATKGTVYYEDDGAGAVRYVLNWLDESYGAEVCS